MGEGGYAVARRIGCSYGALQAANPVTNWNLLRVDQVLNRPCGESSTTSNWILVVGAAVGLTLENNGAINMAKWFGEKIQSSIGAGEAIKPAVITAFQDFKKALRSAETAPAGTAAFYSALHKAEVAADALTRIARVGWTIPSTPVFFMIIPSGWNFSTPYGGTEPVKN